ERWSGTGGLSRRPGVSQCDFREVVVIARLERVVGFLNALKGTSRRLVLLLAPLARGAAGASTEPATEVVGVLESGFGRGLRDRAAAAQSLLGCREALLVAQASQAQAVLTFKFSAERI